MVEPANSESAAWAKPGIKLATPKKNMAHQAHNLPWNTLAGHVKLVRDNPQFSRPWTDLFPAYKANQDNDVSHFCSCFSKAIREFSRTERAKYPARYPRRKHGALFPRDIILKQRPYLDTHTVNNLDRAAGPLSQPGAWPLEIEKATSIERWIEVLSDRSNRSTRYADYNEAVALLLTEEGGMPALLELAQNPDVDLSAVRPGVHANSYGRMVENALKSYLLLGVIFCRPELWTGGRRDHLECSSVRWMIREWYETHHGAFVQVWARRFAPWSRHHWHWSRGWIDDFDPMADLLALREHLKLCWDMMVRYDVFMRERGKVPDWSAMVATMLAVDTFHFKVRIKPIEVRREEGGEQHDSLV